MGWETFYDKTFGGHADLSLVPEEEKAGLSRPIGPRRAR